MSRGSSPQRAQTPAMWVVILLHSHDHEHLRCEQWFFFTAMITDTCGVSSDSASHQQRYLCQSWTCPFTCESWIPYESIVRLTNCKQEFPSCPVHTSALWAVLGTVSSTWEAMRVCSFNWHTTLSSQAGWQHDNMPWIASPEYDTPETYRMLGMKVMQNSRSLCVLNPFYSRLDRQDSNTRPLHPMPDFSPSTLKYHKKALLALFLYLFFFSVITNP